MSSRPTRPPGCVSALDHGDLAAASGQVQRRRQTGQPGADDDHSVGFPATCATTSRHHAARSVHAAAMSASASVPPRRRWPVSTQLRRLADPVRSIDRSIQSHCAGGNNQCLPALDVVVVEVFCAHKLGELAPQRAGLRDDGRRPPRWWLCARRDRFRRVCR